MIPKLRAWDKELKMMCDVLKIDFKNKTLFYHHWAHGVSTEIDLNEVELIQSTGLKDDFGNELFEGDIFESRFSEIKYVVYWDDKLASFWIKGESKEHPLYALTPFHPRILGNIYENPELLEDN